MADWWFGPGKMTLAIFWLHSSTAAWYSSLGRADASAVRFKTVNGR